jgi:uncharacterized protein YxeA
MKIIISIFIILAILYFYKEHLERKNNKLIENLEEYAKKEKAKQQESKIHDRGTKRSKDRKKKRTRMYHI